jgi:hypothetical protein
MKSYQITAIILGIGLASTVEAAPFLYKGGDLLLGFRSAGANDLIVNAGPASGFLSMGYGTTVAVGSLGSGQLQSVFGTLDGISFSAFGDIRASGGAYPLNTLWVSKPRLALDTVTLPWNRQSTFSQGNTAAKIDGIANGGITYSGTTAPGEANNASLVALPKSWNASGVSYSIGVGASGNFAGTFQGGVENTTPAGFTGTDQVLRSDLYELQPNASAGTPGALVGFFELKGNGSMTFTAVPEPGIGSLLGLGAAASFAARRRSKS